MTLLLLWPLLALPVGLALGWWLRPKPRTPLPAARLSGGSVRVTLKSDETAWVDAVAQWRGDV